MPRPELNTVLEVAGRRFEVDCLWRSARLVVELDSRLHHSDAQAFEIDRARDLALLGAGYRTARVTWRRGARLDALIRLVHELCKDIDMPCRSRPRPARVRTMTHLVLRSELDRLRCSEPGCECADDLALTCSEHEAPVIAIHCGGGLELECAEGGRPILRVAVAG